MTSAVTEQTALKAVLGTTAEQLLKSRGLGTVGDLVEFLPRRYLEVNTSGSLAEFALDEPVVLVAEVTAAQTRQMRQRRGRMLEATITDGDGTSATLVFFKAYGHEERLVPGARGLFRGTLRTYRGSLQLAHPDYTILDDADAGVYASGVVPLYPAVPKLTDVQITMSMRLIFEQLTHGPDPLPAHLREKHRLMTRWEALRALHLPTDHAEIGRARKRRRYEEALVVQTVLAQRRADRENEEAVARCPVPGAGLLSAFDQRLPFTLTQGQQRVSREIEADLAQSRPMHRLLQGEVGSGKTIVALRAMLAIVDTGAQAVLLAPTEVLAHQHFRSITGMLGDLAEGGMLGGAEQATRVALLTGGMSTAKRASTLLDIVSGEVGIVIGTHALIQKNVDFFDLGLVVIDEQHRFGVEQRDALRGKAARAPHVLVMTATPIPRTVAMTVFGDMDTSALTELPRGRQPIDSFVIPASRPAWLARAWQRLAEEVAAGHQGYVVCPRIGEDLPVARPGATAEEDLEEISVTPQRPETLETPGAPEAAEAHSSPADAGTGATSLHGVVQTLEHLRAEPALAGLRIEMMHGRLPGELKDATMQSFAAGEIDVLVSTTVIEVGVDVPNATAMVVLDADRFGISQLHQLRGRVGRGSAGGLCLLVTQTQNPDTMERLERVAETTDGFALAELDLELRREGDVLGATQSGSRSQLVLRLTHRADVELIQQARQDAAELIAQGRDLAGYADWAAVVQGRLNTQQAAFLERG